MCSRVPVLYQMVVKSLTSSPPSLNGDLLLDKRIIREAARRWMPRKLCHRPKIGFLKWKDDRERSELMKKLIRSIFPDFREKYLAHQHLVDSKGMIRGFDGLMEDRCRFEELSDFANVMAAVVFQRLCQSLPTPLINHGRPPSPLQELTTIPRRASEPLIREVNGVLTTFTKARKSSAWKAT